MSDLKRLDTSICFICGHPFDGGDHYLFLDESPVGDVCEYCCEASEVEFKDRLNERLKILYAEKDLLEGLLNKKFKN